LRSERGDLVSGRLGPRRLVVEILLVVLAVAGVVTLRVRGLGGTDGINPLLSALPVLMGTALGLVVLRLYPYPLRVLARLASRGRTTVSFLGITQAARQRRGGVLSALVLLMATAIAAFCATVDTSIHDAQEAGAWHMVGADAELSAGNIGPDGVAALKKVHGVTGVLPVRVVPSLTLSGVPTSVTVVAVDMNAYRTLLAGLPIKLPSAPGAAAVRSGDPVPALVSPALAKGAGSHPTLTLEDGETVALHTVGTIGRFPTVDPATRIVVVPHATLTGPGKYGTTVFVRGSHLNPTAMINAAVPSGNQQAQVIVQTHAALHAQLTTAPLVGVLRDVFGYGAFVIGGYGALAVLMALVIGAHARGRTVSYLRTLGLSGRQLSGLAFLELGPLVLSAVLAGWVLGLVLPAIVGPSLDLSPYTAGFPVPTRLLDAGTAGLLAGGLAVVIGVAVAIDSTINARRRLTGLLRIGDQ
jgi:putative ABC transport system permease protein